MTVPSNQCPQCGRPVAPSPGGQVGLCPSCAEEAVRAAEAEVLLGAGEPLFGDEGPTRPAGQAIVVAPDAASPSIPMTLSPDAPVAAAAGGVGPGALPAAPARPGGVSTLAHSAPAAPHPPPPPPPPPSPPAPSPSAVPAPGRLPPPPGAARFRASTSLPPLRARSVVVAENEPRADGRPALPTLMGQSPVGAGYGATAVSELVIDATAEAGPPPAPDESDAPLAAETGSGDDGDFARAVTLAPDSPSASGGGVGGDDGRFLNLASNVPSPAPGAGPLSGLLTGPGPRATAATRTGGPLYRRYADGEILTSEGTTLPAGAKPPTAAVVPLPYNKGDVVGQVGDYDLLAELGRGGMGVVYKAYSLRVRRFVAIKVITAGENASEAQIIRFQNEAALAARVNHPNIVSVFDMGEDRGLHYFVMEYVEGPTLAKMCGSPDVAVRKRGMAVMVKAARAIDAAHKKGVVHRDIKPDNILVSADDEPHITDFGIAKATAEGEAQTGLTALGQAVGTPNYMPPEQANGELAGIGPWSDVYSLGATLYHLLCGQPPFAGERAMGVLLSVVSKEPEPPAKIAARAKLPPVELDDQTVCLKAMEKETARRYQTAAAFGDDLEKALRDEPIKARPVGAVELLQRRLRRNRPLLVGVFVVASVLVTLTAAFGAVTVYNIERSSESLREKDLSDALNQARTLERAIRVNMLLGRADAARELLSKLAADRSVGYIKVVRTDRTIAYTDLSTRKAVEKRLADATVIDKVRDENPSFLERIDELRARAFPTIDANARRDDTKFDFDDETWSRVVDKLKTRWKVVEEDGEPFLYVLRPIKNTKECHVCHGSPDDASYTNNRVRAVLVVKRSQDEVEQVIRQNRRATVRIGLVTVGVFLLLIVIFYKVFGLGVPKRKFAS
ncbi:MAG TPA: protein kinase [Myxococcota bacterium]|nr:protein kinase [Myxococcota bacterium]